MNEHLEFVVEFKDGTRDWVDPVDEVFYNDVRLAIYSRSFLYEYATKDIDKWTIRPYAPETTYDPIEEEVHSL